MKTLYLAILLASQGICFTSATFDFPSFDGAKPFMAALGNLQQYFSLGGGGGGGPSRVVKSAPSSPEASYASATVGYGTILKNPAPMVKASPYGAPRPPMRRPSRPVARPQAKYTPFKGGYYPKFKPQPPGTYEKLKPAVVDHKPYSSSVKEHPLSHKNHHPYEYTRNQVLYTSYTAAPEPSVTKSSGSVIVQQSVRPPILFYHQPQVATSHQVSNLNIKPQQQHNPQPHQHVAPSSPAIPHHRSDNVVDFSRPDPVFAAASMGSDWKPISMAASAPSVISRVYGGAPERRSDPLMHKQVEPPPTVKRQEQPIKKQQPVDRVDNNGYVDDNPSEEIVSAVVFVKKTND